MNTTTVTCHSDFAVGQVDERIFGGFLEHIGRAVYEGVYDPTCAHADEQGFRRDVLEALGRLNMTAMRYPGGNFASGYHWADGVGPKARRPRVQELAWQSTETNHFGTDEYMALCRRMNWTPMLTVNLGTGSPEEAGNWVEYCNSPAGTRFADLRAANGQAQPHGVKLWCLGNEMDGSWQIGHVPAGQYAIRAQQAAKIMKDTDRSLELVACGSCGTFTPTYMEWDRVVLEHLGDQADYVSLHRYVGNQPNDTPDFLAVTNSIDRQIEEMDAVCRFTQARGRRKKRPYLCFDEWNVWYKITDGDGRGKFAPHINEEVYNLEDALVAAGFLHSFLRHADCLKIANIAQIANVIAPILTDGDRMLVQSIFHPFEMFSRRRQGLALRPAVQGPTYEGKTNGPVHTIDASAVLDDGLLHVFLTNRSLADKAKVKVQFNRALRGLRDGELLTGPDAKAANSYEQPDVICPRPLKGVKFAGETAELTLPPLSVAAMTLEL